MCGVKLRDRKRTRELMSMLGLYDYIVASVGQSRLRWYGDVMRKEVAYGIRRVLDVNIAEVVGQGRTRLEWRQAVEKDVLKMGLSEDVLDRPRWRGRVRGISSLVMKR